MKLLDCKGLACPKPVILTKKEIESMESGDIDVLVDNEAAKENVSKLASNYGFSYEIKEENGLFHVIIHKTSSCKVMSQAKDGDFVILVGSDKMGEGDIKLGSVLMKSYLYALAESEVKPKTMMFVNSGVKLTTEGSEVIDSIKSLESQGVEILSCGTCLDFYGLKEKLMAGSVTNMYTIVEKTNKASNTLKI